MRSRLVSLSIIGALILSACGGNDSATTRLRNTAANCFDTADAQALAIFNASTTLNTAQTALTGAGDRTTLDDELAISNDEVNSIEAERTAINAVAMSHWNERVRLEGLGFDINSPPSPERDALNTATDSWFRATKELESLSGPLGTAQLKQSAAQRAVDAWVSASAAVDTSQAALSTAKATPLCVSDEVVAPAPEPEPEDETDDTADATASDDATTLDPYFNAVQNLTAVANEDGSVNLAWSAPTASNLQIYGYAVLFSDLDVIGGTASGGWGEWTNQGTTYSLATWKFSSSNPVTTGYGPVRFGIKAMSGQCVGVGSGTCTYGPETYVDATVLDPTPPTTTGDDDGGDVTASVEKSVCTVESLDVPERLVVGDSFQIVTTANTKECIFNVSFNLSGVDVGNVEFDSVTSVLNARAIQAGSHNVLAEIGSSRLSSSLLIVEPALVGSEEENVVTCGGLQPEVTWSEDNNGTLLTASSCDDAIGVVLEVNDIDGLLVRSTANGNTQVRSVMQSKGPFSYQAWHMCPWPKSSDGWYYCGNVSEGSLPRSGSPADSSGSGAAASVDEASLPTVPVGLLAPMVVPSAGSVEVSTPPTQIAVDPAVVILVCDRDCVADVAERAGVDVTEVGDDGFIADALVELRIDDGEWGYALGGFIPVDTGLVSAEFRVTPINGEPVTFAADFYGNGVPLRDTVSVDSSGDVVDSSGQTVARIPVFEVVADESGTPVLLIVLILLALLVAALVAAFVMKQRRAKLPKSMNTSDSSSSV